jgi:hypothetical protein
VDAQGVDTPSLDVTLFGEDPKSNGADESVASEIVSGWNVGV